MNNLLPEEALGQRRGLMFVLSSPSGAGKTSLSRALRDADPDIELSISVTTRPIRPGEVHGKDYFFVDQATFNTMVEGGELLEHAVVFGNWYGTPKTYVEEKLRSGKDVLFDIDWQGTRQLEKDMSDDVVSIFILPPSMVELERRLRSRAQDSEEVVQHRMDRARSEISHWGEYDYVLVNHDFDRTLQQIRSILHAERLKRTRQPGLVRFVSGL